MISDIALFVTAVGVLGVVYGLRQNYRQRLRQFEELYVKRYWALIDRFSLQILRGERVDQPTVDDEKAIRSYFFLCEDELEMRARNSVSDTTYAIWVAAIREQVEQPMFKDVLNDLRKEETFPYRYLGQLLDGDKGWDPCEMNVIGRWLRGLAGLDGI